MTDSNHPAAIDLIPETRRAIIVALKAAGHATIPQLAQTLTVSAEAVRQQLTAMRSEGWIAPDCAPGEEHEDLGRGRPATQYCLSPAAEDLFPKRYASLTERFFDLAANEETLASLTDERVKAVPHAATLDKQVERLRSIYVADDPYTEVEKTADGYLLIERNCPYLQFATERPVFCSTTVSALRRLTGREVVREQRFQDRDGKCVFHVYANAELTGRRRTKRFEVEPEKNARPL